MRSAARRGTPRKEGLSAHARDLKHARYALWKNPEDLTDRQQKKLAWVSTVNRRLYRAYLLEEQLRQGVRAQERGGQTAARSLVVLGPALPHPRIRAPGQADHQAPRLDRCQPRAPTIERPGREHEHKRRLLTRIAFGFTSPEAMIALAMFNLGGYCPPLPGRAVAA